MEYNKIQKTFYKAKTEDKLPQEVHNGNILYTDDNKLFIDTSNGRNRVNPQSDWNETDTDSSSYINNKPELGSIATYNIAEDLDDSDNIPTAKMVSEAISSIGSSSSGSWNEIPYVPIYGVKWYYNNSSPKLERIVDAKGFSNPVPAIFYGKIGRSPFDNIYPWCDMKVVNIMSDGTIIEQGQEGFSTTQNDTMVWIPEFYYRSKKDENLNVWTWEICGQQENGFKKHPGSGRYIGKYHASGSADGVYSKADSWVFSNITKSDFSTYFKNKGTGWYMLDIATWSAVQMLYLVEFADFNSQNNLGTARDPYDEEYEYSGRTANIDYSYHTYKSNNNYNMYRYIEDLFGTCYDLVDGYGVKENMVCLGSDNNAFTSDLGGLTKTQIKVPEYHYDDEDGIETTLISNFGYDPNFDWAFVPSECHWDYNNDTYVTDEYNRVNNSYESYICCVGGDSGSSYQGLFCYDVTMKETDCRPSVGSRPIYIPQS